MMKKMMAILAAVLLLCTSALAAPSDWAAAEIGEVMPIGFVPERFAADWQANITRAEFAETAVRFTATNLGYTEAEFPAYAATVRIRTSSFTDPAQLYPLPKTDTVSFTDTTDPYVLLAADLGIVMGRGDGTFDPDGAITREEAAVMLLRTYGLYSGAIQFSANTFADTDEIASWAKLGTAFVRDKGVMQGVGENRFAPHDFYTKEQSALTFLRLYKDTVWQEHPGFYRYKTEEFISD